MSGHNDSDDEHDEETYFAGGERSGISVQNPGRGRGGGPGVDLVRDLLRKAQEEGASGGEAPATRSGFFSGGGHTLGGEGSASTPDRVNSVYLGRPGHPNSEGISTEAVPRFDEAAEAAATD
ncbi:hypothetical protein B0H14DRAFT_3905044 [Mycena olivaceomarginata]|nr:hypothetical protein B0H14DRAFT_3905044 [Mycena olivaceomarginata]